VFLSLAPIIMLQPNFANSLTVYAPIPEFPPVTIAFLPFRLIFGMLNDPPLKYFFK